MNAELTGRRVGVYELHERIGAGGMGDVYRARDTRLRRDVAVKIIVSMPDRTSKRLIDGTSRHGATRFSPDVKWVAYSSDETGRFEVFVRPFANGQAAMGKIQVSESGGDFPVWRSDGEELYFMSEDATIHAVPTGTLRVDGPVPRPQVLFRPCPGSAPQSPPMSGQFWGNPYDTLDGNRFIVNCSIPPSREYVVLMNWPLAQNR